MTRLRTGGEGEARRGSSGLVGVLAHGHVLLRHGRGLGGGEQCIQSSGECGRVVREMRGGGWVHWIEEGAHGFARCK
jgi:hypothetical protein